ncbi:MULTISPECIES: glutamate racemase [unclassified Roseofilum]|uniref:glutamate racemase n=1 Tax=unclassified Roseofilum TaxID=2620099 RepID=UPI001B0D8706|nr:MULTISPECIES: glutamate racemase [unclassified Roseofilum]MBP0008208.1 glutamate racemase [Roseofilum sp. Belize Diploria]MBP0015490.1 glutamate racemase [Roseofilum sp. SID3]MBP0023192.1 glutamate racemase [Roseofilum sp. SID2]MBP0041526.1 glutamate racemase [Roseofilum sp. SBFL]
MTINHRPIGVFDSGVGGLTVLSELYRQLPQESIIYFGDTARLPYGTRSPEEIIQFVREIITWMEQQQVKMVVMACNTSNALALEAISDEFSTPILGLILPAARAAVAVGKRVGVIATPATAASQAYRQAMIEVDPTVQVWQVGCPEFVPLIEQNRINDPYTYEVARSYLQPLLQQNIDTLVYGCTHYPLLDSVIRQLLPKSVQVINPAVHVVKATGQELDLLGLRNAYAPKPTRFGVSGSPQQFTTRSLCWLGYTPLVEQVYLSPVPVSNARECNKENATM